MLGHWCDQGILSLGYLSLLPQQNSSCKRHEREYISIILKIFFCKSNDLSHKIFNTIQIKFSSANIQVLKTCFEFAVCCFQQVWILKSVVITWKGHEFSKNIPRLRCYKTFSNLELWKYVTLSWTCRIIQVTLFSKLLGKLRCCRTSYNLELRNCLWWWFKFQNHHQE